MRTKNEFWFWRSFFGDQDGTSGKKKLAAVEVGLGPPMYSYIHYCPDPFEQNFVASFLSQAFWCLHRLNKSILEGFYNEYWTGLTAYSYRAKAIVFPNKIRKILFLIALCCYRNMKTLNATETLITFGRSVSCFILWATSDLSRTEPRKLRHNSWFQIKPSQKAAFN